MECCGKDRISVFLFDGKIVGNGVLLGDASAPRKCAGVVEKALCERGLSGTIVTEEGDVFDVVRIVDLHVG